MLCADNLQMDQPRFESVDKCSVIIVFHSLCLQTKLKETATFSSVHTMPFPKYVSRPRISFSKNLPLPNLLAKTLSFSCEREV